MTAESPLLEVDGPTAAAVLGLSVRHFRRLVRDGVIPQQGKRRYVLPAVVQAFVTYVSAGREGAGDLAEERRLLTVAQRRQIELAMRVRSGDLVELLAAERVFDAAMVIVGGQLDGLAGRLAGELAVLTDPALIRQRLFDECRRIRRAAADEIEALATGLAGREAAPAAADENG